MSSGFLKKSEFFLNFFENISIFFKNSWYLAKNSCIETPSALKITPRHIFYACKKMFVCMCMEKGNLFSLTNFLLAVATHPQSMI